VKQGLKMLRNLDDMMLKAGVPRQDRRALWREVSHEGKARDQVIDKIAKKLGVEE